MTTVAVLFCVLLAALAVFQVALIAGAPWGRFAWGGQDAVLPRSKRVGSVVSVALYALFCVVALLSDGGDEPLVVSIAMWVIAVYLTLGIALNAVSRSRPERFTMTPVAALLAGLAIALAAA